MLLQDFKNYARYLIEESKFNRLFEMPASNNTISKEYLENRNLPIEECYYFRGDFNYRGQNYKLNDCIVVPLRSPNNELRGVWIRFIHEKRFFIWMLNINPEPQKYWIPKNIDFTKEVYVCESIFDAASLGKMLNTNQVVACLGVQPSGDLLSLMHSSEVILALDNDVAGRKSALNLLTLHPKWSIIQISNKEKDFNDILKSSQELQYKILPGIQAKIYLRSIL